MNDNFSLHTIDNLLKKYSNHSKEEYLKKPKKVLVNVQPINSSYLDDFMTFVEPITENLIDYNAQNNDLLKNQSKDSDLPNQQKRRRKKEKPNDIINEQSNVVQTNELQNIVQIDETQNDEQYKLIIEDIKNEKLKYILSDPRKKGGVEKWTQLTSTIIDAQILYDHKLLSNFRKCIIYVNNYINDDFFSRLDEYRTHNRLYYVIHSDLCPNNVFFVNNIDKFYGIVCTNNYILTKVKNIYFNKNLDIFYIPNTINISPINIIRESQNRIHFVGRLTAEKNIPMLIDSMVNVVKNVNNVKLFIYGFGDIAYENFLKELCNMNGLNDTITFINGEYSLDKLYSDADYVILPSVHEGLAYCLLEAQKYNKKIICHNISNLEYHIKNGVYYKYKGINDKIINETLYVDNYNVLLQMIGYVDVIITRKISEKILLNLATVNGKIIYGSKFIVPPNILRKNFKTCYNDNVKILSDVIIKTLKN